MTKYLCLLDFLRLHSLARRIDVIKRDRKLLDITDGKDYHSYLIYIGKLFRTCIEYIYGPMVESIKKSQNGFQYTVALSATSLSRIKSLITLSRLTPNHPISQRITAELNTTRSYSYIRDAGWNNNSTVGVLVVNPVPRTLTRNETSPKFYKATLELMKYKEFIQSLSTVSYDECVIPINNILIEVKKIAALADVDVFNTVAEPIVPTVEPEIVQKAISKDDEMRKLEEIRAELFGRIPEGQRPAMPIQLAFAKKTMLLRERKKS